MKVGIISMQRVPNYGSYLQAYGLKQIIEGLGHDVGFIDYKEGTPVVPFSKAAQIKYKILNLNGVLAANDWFKYTILGKKNFVYEYRMRYLKDLGIGYKKKADHADAVVIGSDEVFNCLQAGFNVGFSPMLFGCGVPAEKVISYAASFGYTNLNGLNQYGVKQQVAAYLEKLNDISVRDENSKEIVYALTGRQPETNLDPVLIADYKLSEIDTSFGEYVILYTYKTREYSESEKTQIKEFCRKNKKKLISIGNAQNWVDMQIHASPLELLAYFRKADFIITDTFHGSVFSIKYNKCFATMIRENNRQKLTDLLMRLKRHDRIIQSFEDLQMMYEKPIDYHETNEIIMMEKEHTLSYLRRNLNRESE